MIDITLNAGDLQSNYGLSKEEIDGLLDYVAKETAASFAEEWEKAAMNNLHQSRDEYIRNIILVDRGRGIGTVVLTGSLPNKIEQGAGSWDMKPALLSGRGAKQGKNGKYNTVPFQHAASTSLGENPNFNKPLPKAVNDVIKKKKQEIPVAGGGRRSEGLKAGEIPKPFDVPITKTVKMPVSGRFVEYSHKHSIYEGVTRQKDPKTNQNSYFSFRRVSENSDPASWIHPGFVAKNLADLALSTLDIKSVVDYSTREFLENI